MDAKKQFENELSAVFVRWWEESDLEDLDMARIAVKVVDRFCDIDIEYEPLEDDFEYEFEPEDLEDWDVRLKNNQMDEHEWADSYSPCKSEDIEPCQQENQKLKRVQHLRKGLAGRATKQSVWRVRAEERSLTAYRRKEVTEGGNYASKEKA